MSILKNKEKLYSALVDVYLGKHPKTTKKYANSLKELGLYTGEMFPELTDFGKDMKTMLHLSLNKT